MASLDNFYKPYQSDESEEESSSESDYESESESESSVEGFSGAPVKKPVLPRNTISSPTKFNQTKTAFTSSKNTTTIMINSSDRDTTVYAQPTLFTIRLPRIYRNVVSLNVTQIKLLSSFYYFSNSKNNTSLRVAEYNRTKVVNGVDISNTKDIYIREGTYDASSLVTELNNQLNRTPIYNTITISDFIAGFITTGNYSLLFNDPGDTTYNPLTGVFEPLAAKTDIVARYFKTGTNVGIQYYSTDQCKVAYFYPLLRDYTIAQVPVTTPAVANPYLNTCTTYVVSGAKTYEGLDYKLSDATTAAYLGSDTYYNRIVYSFKGVDIGDGTPDPYILSVISDTGNQALLEQYKADNTWNNFLVNEYVCNYDSTVGRLTIYSQQLNTSLVTTLNAQYSQILVKELINNGIAPADVAGLQTTADNLNGVIADMYNYIQKGFTDFFGISYGNYAAEFYKTLSNELFLYDASGRYGWNLAYSGLPQAKSSLIAYPDASGYWPNLQFNTASGEFISGDLYYPDPSKHQVITAPFTPSPAPVPVNGGFVTLTIAAGLGFQTGNAVIVISSTLSTNRFNGTVFVYDSMLGTIVINNITGLNGVFYDSASYIIATTDITNTATSATITSLTTNSATIAAVLISPATFGTVVMTIGSALSISTGNSLLVTDGTNSFNGTVVSYASATGLLTISSLTNITGTFTNPNIYNVYVLFKLSPVAGNSLTFNIGTGLTLPVATNVLVSNGPSSFNGKVTAYNLTTGAVTLNNVANITGTFSTVSVYTLYVIPVINPLPGGNVIFSAVGLGLTIMPGNSVLVKNGSNQFNGIVNTYNSGTGYLKISNVSAILGSFSSPTIYTIYASDTATTVPIVITQPLTFTASAGTDIKVGNIKFVQTSQLDAVTGKATGSFTGKVSAYNIVTGLITLVQISNISGTFPNDSYKLEHLVRYTYTYLPHVDANGFIDLSGANENTYGFQDISFNIVPTTYSKILFKSRCRQTLFIETIPPFVNEIPMPPKLAETYYLDLSSTPLLFNTAGTCLLDPTAADFYLWDISQNMLDGPIYMQQQTATGQIFLNFIREQKPVALPNQVPPPGSLGLYTFRPHIFFEIHHGRYPVPSTPTKFKSDIYIEREDSLPFGVTLDAYWYRDRAAYMADVSSTLVNIDYNNPKNWFIHQTIAADISSSHITTDFISDEISYLMIIVKQALFQSINLRVFVLRHDPYGVYTTPTVSDFRRLPATRVDDPTYFQTKSTPSKNFPNPYPTLFNSKGFRNSYDISGVSNNLLDYMILTTDFSHYDPYSFANTTTVKQSPLQFVFQHKSNAIGPPVDVSKWSQFFYSTSLNSTVNSLNAVYDSSGQVNYYTPASAVKEIANSALPFKGISNEFIFTNWFRAGALQNLYNNVLAPPPEQTVATYPTLGGDPWTVLSPISYSPSKFAHTKLYKQSPFVICKNTKAGVISDISFNDLSGHVSYQQIFLGKGGGEPYDISGIIGIPFQPPMGKYVLPTRIVIKYSYIQPLTDNNRTIQGRRDGLSLTGKKIYVYNSYSNPVSYSVSGELALWDDHYYLNRRNVVLGVFRSKDIQSTNVSTLLITNALCTLTLKKVTQVCQYSSTTDPKVNYTKTRTPDWGTYYVYERKETGSNVWAPLGQSIYDVNGNPVNLQTVTDANLANGTMFTNWSAITKTADISSNIFMTSAQSDLASYYTDVSNNSLCFVPFYPVLSPGQTGIGPFTKSLSNASSWAVGTFNGLTYTAKPYVPVTKNSLLGENKYIFDPYKTVSVNIIGNDGVSMGANSTYLGSCGPICWGKTSTGFITSPNYRKTYASYAVSSISSTGSSVKYTVVSSANATIGATVIVTGAIVTGYNGTFTVIATTPTSITVSSTATGVSSTANLKLDGFLPTYFNIRVNIRMPDTFYNPISDFTKFGGYTDVSNCLVDTQTYLYNLGSRPGSDFNDISGAWGSEKAKRFVRFNDDAGYNNLSYMPSVFAGAAVPFSINVRGYVPTVKFLSGVRIMGKNWIDFGQTSLNDLITEIADLTAYGIFILPDGRINNNGIRIAKYYTSNYVRALLTFNQYFIGTFTVGRGYTNATYAGQTITTTGFGDYINQFIGFNNQISTSATGISNAQTEALNATRAYIVANYSGILPTIVLDRNRFTDSIPFSLQFKSQLASSEYLQNYLKAYDQWGLGWNLGFDKVDTTFTTRHVATTFIRIVDDYIYLKLNDELNINTIDISQKENLAQSRETFGASRRYYGKLLLNTFGSYAQTFVQAAKALPAPIGKLDKLSFQLVDAFNNKISNADCEYNIVFEVTEIADSIDTSSTLVKGAN